VNSPPLTIALGVALLGACRGGEKRPAADPAGHPGTVNFPISCSPPAQREFNRAVALLHHMTYPQARQAFQHVATTDPRCAMAQWGVAMTLFQPLWPTRPDSATRARGWDAVRQAWALVPPTRRESLFVAATDTFFRDPRSTDYWQRIGRWKEASGEVHSAFPDDAEATAFYALSLLATAPSNTAAPENFREAADLLLALYRQNPDHPGAMHYLVHANDAPGRESLSIDVTHKYEQAAPHNPHALHMPTHIYTRLGDWDGVIRGNLLAADAALQYPAGDKGEYVWDEFPHAIEYLVYAYLQQGKDDSAAVQLERLRTTARLEPSFKTAFHLSSTSARYALERRDWEAAALIEPRQPAALDWDHFAWPEAISQFARGLGAAHLGRLKEAQARAARLAQLDSAMTKAGEDLFARNIRLLQLELSAWIAEGEGKRAVSRTLMQQAVDLEGATPKHAVTPGPTLPATELQGDLLMLQKLPAQALAAYQRSLELYPRRFNSTLGAAGASAALGNEAAAEGYYQLLLDIAGSGLRPVHLAGGQGG
jgi:tetratricopeptide (TPR) repeat protein